MNESKDSKELVRFFPWVIGSIWLFWVIAILAHGYGMNLFRPIHFDFESAGQFGDSFGSLSGFMASLAAAGAWYAVHLQRKEMANNVELRTEEKKERTAQAFEQRFFQLLSHFSEIVRDTDIEMRLYGRDVRTDVHTGKDAYRRLCLTLRDEFKWNEEKLLGHDQCEEIYKSFYLLHEDDIGHYFRILYHICDLVQVTECINKRYYLKLVFAQLSNSELLLLAYNCAFGRGQIKFRPIVEGFSGLSNLSFDKEVPREEAAIRQYLSAGAFE